MLTATERPEVARGATLLLAHCAAVDRLSDDGRRPARARLEDAVGGGLARLLIGALAAQRGVSRDLIC